MSVTSFEELLSHRGHRVEISTYFFNGSIVENHIKDDQIENIAIECIDCHEVLIDFNRNITKVSD